MRRLFGILLVAGASSVAVAGEFDDSWLRGSSSFAADPPRYQRWSGLYGGGQIGADFHSADFRGATGAMINNIAGQDSAFTNIPLTSFDQLPVNTSMGTSFGGFIGYNYQIDDIVAGFELNLNRSGQQSSATSAANRSIYECINGASSGACTTPGVNEGIGYSVTSTAAATLNAYGTLRARFGWAYGNFLPYVFGGVSVSQVDTSRAVNVSYASGCTIPVAGSCVPVGSPAGGYNQSDNSHGKWVFGFDTGLGIDYAVTRNVFVRLEAEYLQLSSANDIKLNTTSVRAGAGLKF